jgi:hypothetical protein
VQVVRATRRVSVAMVLGVGRIGCADGRVRAFAWEEKLAKRLGRILWRGWQSRVRST